MTHEMTKKWQLIFLFLLGAFPMFAQNLGVESCVVTQKHEGYFPLATDNLPVPVIFDSGDYPGVVRAANNLREDLRQVTGNLPLTSSAKYVVLIGTIGQSPTIDQLVKNGKIAKDELVGKNEKFIITTVAHPANGIDQALVIAGSDKRGTIYGIYELSKQIGVSPWYYWADVPILKQSDLYVKPGTYTDGEPAVQYRGIFLNDEAPALSGWSKAVFGGYNHRFYEKVFELILRLKGNFLWPAMWGSAFYDDDPLNGVLADEYGIVMGTSHHEPMALAQQDWKRRGTGAWDYQKNGAELRQFWKTGIERAKNWEKLVTVGMRGDGDEPMSEKSNIALLQRIVKDQRQIIQQVTNKKPEQVPQVWALYKEVQEYYDKGMCVPDDITLLLCDDNWGNVRKLPSLDEPKRKGGYGMYYHFDYVGGPRNYKWINVSQIQRVWEQMNLTYQYGVDKIWIVNVGDLKPMEFPISFFLDMAWSPNRFDAHNLMQYTEQWCSQQFGEKYAKEAARLINLYTKYNRRITPELLNEKTYSLQHYNEFETVVNDYRTLVIDAMRLYYLLPEVYKDAYDQLVLFPIDACSNLYEMYYAVAKNHDLAARQDPEANVWFDKAQQCYERDSLLTLHYNHEIAGGKWPHMMDQIRIGYTYWQQPEHRLMPTLKRVDTSTLPSQRKVFDGADGYVSIEAEHYTNKKESPNISWVVIPHLGKTLSGITTQPVTAIPQAGEAIYLEYEISLNQSGEANLIVFLSPTLNFNANRGLRYAVSIDGGNEQIVNFNETYTERERETWVANSIIRSETKHHIDRAGTHTIRFRILDPGIVLQKLILDMGGLKPSYLGAPQSPYKTVNQ